MLFLETIFTFSMASHPQTDGMAEVTNHTTEQSLYIYHYVYIENRVGATSTLVAMLFYTAP